MTIVRVGATKKYSDGWESAFGKGKKKSATKKKAATKKKPVSAKKKPAKKSAKTKQGRK